MDIANGFRGHWCFFRHWLTVFLDYLAVFVPLRDSPAMIQKAVVKLLNGLRIEPGKFDIPHSWENMGINSFPVRIPE